MIKAELTKVYGDSAPSLSIIIIGQRDIFDEDLPNRPNEATISEIIENINKIVIND